MTSNEITNLVSEIDDADFREFWWDSPLLARAATVRDSRVVQSLAIRHHRLSNKKAFSAHVVRNTIKLNDGPDFPSLWQMVDSESDASRIEEHFEDLVYPPWAAAFILGEIGGASAFIQTTHRFTPEHSARFFLLVRLLSHLMVRYLKIPTEAEPTSTMIDIETGAKTTVATASLRPATRRMEMLRREQANEYFTPIPSRTLQNAHSQLRDVPDRVFNYPKLDFLSALNQLPRSG